MPNNTQYRNTPNMYGTRNTYAPYRGERLYSGTSSAYDIPTVYPQSKPKVDTSAASEKRQKQIKSNSVGINRAKLKKTVVAAGIFFLLCLTVLYRYAVLLQCNQEIEGMSAELEELLATNQAMQTKIDKQLEMSEIEKYAKAELGMMKPQAYQITYIDMNMGDGGGDGTVPKSSASAVSGVPGVLVNAFRVLK